MYIRKQQKYAKKIIVPSTRLKYFLSVEIIENNYNLKKCRLVIINDLVLKVH